MSAIDWYYKHKNDADYKLKRVINTRNYRARHKGEESFIASNKAMKERYYNKHRNTILERNRKYKKEHPELFRRMAVNWKNKAKLEVIGHYSHGTFQCHHCGYDDIRALSIDHINGGGSKHRKSIKGYLIYAWLRKNNYPEGYQVLCMNCQFIKKYENKECLKYADDIIDTVNTNKIQGVLI